MDIYKERIKSLFEKSGKTDADLEKEIGIPAKKISQWNIGYTKSYQKYIPQIASYFHVSTDYLLGNTDDPSPSGQKQKPTQEGEPLRSEAKQKLVDMIDALDDAQCEKLYKIIMPIIAEAKELF